MSPARFDFGLAQHVAVAPAVVFAYAVLEICLLLLCSRHDLMVAGEVEGAAFMSFVVGSSVIEVDAVVSAVRLACAAVNDFKLVAASFLVPEADCVLDVGAFWLIDATADCIGAVFCHCARGCGRAAKRAATGYAVEFYLIGAVGVGVGGGGSVVVFLRHAFFGDGDGFCGLAFFEYERGRFVRKVRAADCRAVQGAVIDGRWAFAAAASCDGEGVIAIIFYGECAVVRCV